jgi:hypothetical protein
MPRPRLGEAPMTSAERQAKRREQFRQMREALSRIAAAKTVREARQIAQDALSEIVQ